MEEVKADDFLSKPFSSASMIEKIEHYVKPIIHSENNAVTISAEPEKASFQFGIKELDDQLYGQINAESFILVEGSIGSGKSNLTRQFIMDGIQKKQQSLLLSFETPNRKLDPIFKMTSDQESFLTFCDASQWTAIDAKPWRNIDYIFDYLYDTCAKNSIDRIVIDSFSHGFAFWPITDILKFVDLCRTLPNAEQQCILWTINTHPSIEGIMYHLQHAMDIGVLTSVNKGAFKTTVQYSKWQSYCSDQQPATEKNQQKLDYIPTGIY